MTVTSVLPHLCTLHCSPGGDGGRGRRGNPGPAEGEAAERAREQHRGRDEEAKGCLSHAHARTCTYTHTHLLPLPASFFGHGCQHTTLFMLTYIMERHVLVICCPGKQLPNSPYCVWPPHLPASTCQSQPASQPVKYRQAGRQLW